MKALVITDNCEVAEDVSLWFQVRWPEATLICTADGNTGTELAKVKWPDIIVLDLDLPGADGCDIFDDICLFSNAPLIVLTSSNEEMDKALVLELGADCCLSEPLSRVELLARVGALLRRTRMAEHQKGNLLRNWQRTRVTNLISPMSIYAAN